MNECAQCGMMCVDPNEYHPYAACLMFMGCHDGDIVRANLAAVCQWAQDAEATAPETEAKDG